jgi:hypothetical protein
MPRWSSRSPGCATAGKRVFLILQPPSGNLFDPRSMITGSRFGEMKPRTDMEPFRVARFYSDNAAPRNRLLQIAQATGAVAIDPVDTICKDGICPTVTPRANRSTPIRSTCGRSMCAARCAISTRR